MTPDEAIIALKSFGFSWSDAEAIADAHPPAVIEQQLEWFPERKITGDRIQFMRDAIKSNADPPPVKKRAPVVWPTSQDQSSRSRASYDAERAISMLPESEQLNLRKRAMVEIALDVCGAAARKRFEETGAKPTLAEFNQRWMMPERMLDIVLAARCRTIYLRDYRPAPEPLAFNDAVAIADGVS